ncbi:DUF262 domain-containing protein [Myxococcus qinghaiensis]|uniref:DUF262 domain-containing protein n=1 Tax=Myxococcus qinghaiensis TaxID=2906758 RepID=UPI0020A7282E|nr:DUF262 domain-containing protein [Myxococcus qinghaiensis]MCP3167407.1 DUF262 domain-containing protein [Myxococcus qinghaiensis]
MATKRRDTAVEEERVDMGTAAPNEQSLASLEEKYSQQMRQIFPTKIDLPWLTLKTQIDEQINLRPDFQRRDRWNNEKRSRFIESVIMNVPVPPVFLGEEEYGKYVVLDGRQRLTAAYKFLSNELRVEGLKIWTELNGLTYADIKKKGFAATVERRFLPAILLTHESSPEVKYEVFDRLNTGGVIAEQMEVRNAIFPGPFNVMLHELSRDHTFRQLWGIPNSDDPVALEKNVLYREMGDLELVLRFFSLREGTLKSMRFKDRLSDVMSEQNTAFRKDSSLQAREAAVFRQAITNCAKVFGDDAFKLKKDPSKKANRSAPYADAVMQALADRPTAALTPDVARRIRSAFEKLCMKNQEFRRAVEKGTNGETAINDRISLARAAVDEALKGGAAARKPLSKRFSKKR